MSQGKGIYLTRCWEDIDTTEHCITQRYIHNPYLIEGLKFDFRIYILLFGVDPIRIFMYEEGLTRFATEKYISPMKGNLQNFYMHLTNYAINKNSEKYVFN
jgi:tubulin polyglutamylase TTLL6/13